MKCDERMEKLDELKKECDKFESLINENQIWNLNDGVNVPEYIDLNNPDWKMFMDNVNTYFIMSGEEEKNAEFHGIINTGVIDKKVLGNLKVYFNHLQNEIQIEIQQGK